MVSASIVPGAASGGQLDGTFDGRAYYFFRTGGGLPPTLGLVVGAGAGVALALALGVDVALGVGVEVEVEGAAVAVEDGVDAVAEVASLGDAGGGGGLEASKFAGIEAAVRSAPTKRSAIARALAAETSASRSDRCATASAFIL
jgi:hypothetical protein